MTKLFFFDVHTTLRDARSIDAILKHIFFNVRIVENILVNSNTKMICH
jgi:hypothetical protein